MILSHLSGIRHYEKDAKKVREDKEKAKRLLKPPVQKKEDVKSSAVNKDKPATEQNTNNKEFTEHEEYYLKDNFESVTQALDLFKDDPLIFKPGKAHICLRPHASTIQFQCCRVNEYYLIVCFSINYMQAPLSCTPPTLSFCLVL